MFAHTALVQIWAQIAFKRQSRVLHLAAEKCVVVSKCSYDFILHFISQYFFLTKKVHLSVQPHTKNEKQLNVFDLNSTGTRQAISSQAASGKRRQDRQKQFNFVAIS